MKQLRIITANLVAIVISTSTGALPSLATGPATDQPRNDRTRFTTWQSISERSMHDFASSLIRSGEPAPTSTIEDHIETVELTGSGHTETGNFSLRTLSLTLPSRIEGSRAAGQISRNGSECLCRASIFADGFESGDTAAWTRSEGRTPELDGQDIHP